MTMPEAEDRPLLSACLIVRNEEHNLPRCLESLRGLADELVVVDTGSADRTVEIARSFGSVVAEQAWRNDFAFHRNQSLDMATGRWCLVVDADEEVVETDREQTRRRLAEDGLTPVLLVRERLRYETGNDITVLVPRLVRRSSGIRFVHPVHEQLKVTDMPARLSNVSLLHHGYTTVEAQYRKERRNLELGKAMGDHSHGLHTVVRSAFSLGLWDDVVEHAERLAERSKQADVVAEGCALGAAAAVFAGDLARARKLLVVGRAVDPGSPDLLRVEVACAAAEYAVCVGEAGLDRCVSFARAPIFRHDDGAHTRVLAALGLKSEVSRPPATAAEGNAMGLTETNNACKR